MNISEATRRWVNEFSNVPLSVVEKLIAGGDLIDEITPLTSGDCVCACVDGEDRYGIIQHAVSNGVYCVKLDGGQIVHITVDEMDVQRDVLPMWGTMWAFGSPIDNWWLSDADENGLQKMADCGFRIYEQEDYEYLFGIDGAGYDFYHEHWEPLYRARGLQWHDE